MVRSNLFEPLVYNHMSTGSIPRIESVCRARLVSFPLPGMCGIGSGASWCSVVSSSVSSGGRRARTSDTMRCSPVPVVCGLFSRMGWSSLAFKVGHQGHTGCRCHTTVTRCLIAAPVEGGQLPGRAGVVGCILEGP